MTKVVFLCETVLRLLKYFWVPLTLSSEKRQTMTTPHVRSVPPARWIFCAYLAKPLNIFGNILHKAYFCPRYVVDMHFLATQQ